MLSVNVAAPALTTTVVDVPAPPLGARNVKPSMTVSAVSVGLPMSSVFGDVAPSVLCTVVSVVEPNVG